MSKNCKYKITSYNASFSLKEYADRYQEKQSSENDTMDIGKFFAPCFQRNFVWPKKTQSKLIETFLINLPVPPVVLYKNIKGQHEIIDGYQRIRSIHDFLCGKLKLVDLDSEYNGYTINDLSEIERAKLETKMLNCIMVEDMSDDENRAFLYEIFTRLNSGGMNLNNMEIRRAIGWGIFLYEIENFKNSELWNRVWGGKPTKRYEDEELILRILALSEEGFNKSMREFLNDYLEKNKDVSKQGLLDDLSDVLQQVLEQYKSEKPFHRENAKRANFAAADAILSVLLRNKGNIFGLENKLHMLLDFDRENLHLDEETDRMCREFQEICFKGQGSMTKKAVTSRMAIAERILLS